MPQALQAPPPELAAHPQLAPTGGVHGRHELALLAAQGRILDHEKELWKGVVMLAEEIIVRFRGNYPALEKKGIGINKFNDVVCEIEKKIEAMKRAEATAEIAPGLPLPSGNGPEARLLAANMRKVSANHAYFGLVELFVSLHSSLFRFLQKTAAEDNPTFRLLKPMLMFLQALGAEMQKLAQLFAIRSVNFPEALLIDTQVKMATEYWNQFLAQHSGNEYVKTLLPHGSKPGRKRLVYFAIGGLGDALLQTPAIAELKRRFAPCEILFIHSRPVVASLMKGNRNIDAALYVPDTLLINLEKAVRLVGVFDLVLEARFLVWGELCAGSRILSGKDLQWIAATQRAAAAFAPYLERFPLYSNLMARIVHPKMLLDVQGDSTALPVTVDSPLSFFPAAADASFPGSLGLLENGFVTVHDGFDETFGKEMGIARCTKQLPLATWKQLIDGLQREGLKVVQVGSAAEPLLPDVDLDLRGKTSLSQLCFILKAAAVHVDTEGGIVHVARAAHKKSIVFFGPTSVSFWGYPRNTNLVSSEYADCWWINSDWMKASPLKAAPSPMEGFDVAGIPELVAREIAAEKSREYRVGKASVFSAPTDRKSLDRLKALFRAADVSPVDALHSYENNQTGTQVSAAGNWAYLYALDRILEGHDSLEGLNVADVGGGRSGLVFGFAEQGADIEVIDIDYGRREEGGEATEERFLACANRAARASFGSLYNIPANSDSYDVVTCIYAIEHVSPRRPALAELLRLLKPGGILVLAFAIGEKGDPKGGSLDAQALAGLLREHQEFGEVISQAQVQEGVRRLGDSGIEGVPAGTTFGAVCLTRER